MTISTASGRIIISRISVQLQSVHFFHLEGGRAIRSAALFSTTTCRVVRTVGTIIATHDKYFVGCRKEAFCSSQPNLPLRSVQETTHMHDFLPLIAAAVCNRYLHSSPTWERQQHPQCGDICPEHLRLTSKEEERSPVSTARR